MLGANLGDFQSQVGLLNNPFTYPVHLISKNKV